jgi:hypothetical protein
MSENDNDDFQDAEDAEDVKDAEDAEDAKNNISQIKKFCKVKTYALNFQLNEEHINNMVRQINENKDKNIYFPNSIALIEYSKISSDSPKDIIEIIDGHHRIECIKILLRKKTITTMSLWIQIYKASRSASIKTKNIFKLYNTVKPFKINFEIIEFKILLVAKLNDVYKTVANTANIIHNGHNFILIKDSVNNVYRPSIQQKAFCDTLERQRNIQIQVVRKDLTKDMVDMIVNKFKSYNKTIIKEKDFVWFNNKTAAWYSSKITENQYKIAKDNKCMLGLIKLEFLISQCVCL